MYVTTFYSFKGGVGRSMALANVAVELAQRGRRVLVVDFDLEAPGLDTFDVLRPQHAVPGVIDFVRGYLDSDRAPDAVDFFARLPDIGRRGGQLWIMPSGAQQTTYATHFNQIDWAELYEKRDGYLLFEDLKGQWEQAINPDYVLIDSRTGHTDTGGICTRQLPDAVTILFFPNEQNLRGLTKVVNDIRSETEEPRRKRIELHFVMSNVPDLDDENRILDGKLREFRDQLSLTKDPLIVHRYDSLSLLNQAVFTLDRPKSRLAKEYCAVVDELVGRNLDDRDGALEYIDRTTRAWEHGKEVHDSPDALEEQLRRIERAHSEDGEVLFALGKFRESDPRVEGAPALFDRAIESGYDRPDVYLQRAYIRSRNNEPGAASEDALRALQEEGVPLSLIWEAVRLTEPDKLDHVAGSPAVTSLDLPQSLALGRARDDPLDTIKLSMPIVKRIVGDTSRPESDRKVARGTFAMRFIEIGKCSEAIELLGPDRDPEDMDIADSLNYGMATWGANGSVVTDPFVRVLECDRARPEPRSDDPSYLQAMAIASWAAGEPAAIEFVARARQAMAQQPAPDSMFSWWRYTVVSANEFKGDLDDIYALIGGDATQVPRFMRN